MGLNALERQGDGQEVLNLPQFWSMLLSYRLRLLQGFAMCHIIHFKTHICLWNVKSFNSWNPLLSLWVLFLASFN